MLDLKRARLVIGVVWLAGLGIVWAAPAPAESVVINHWANGHMMTDPLLPAFAKAFNAAGNRTSSGRIIEVRTYLANSSVISSGLIGRVDPTKKSPACEAVGCVPPSDLPEPTVVTPAADHWLYDVNFEARQRLVQTQDAWSLAMSWIGIVALREMAGCLGWPEAPVGFADVVDLRLGERQWGCLDPQPEWAAPRFVFTIPQSSSTGRSVLFTLLTIPNATAPQEITVDDVAKPGVRRYFETFMRAVDRWEADTLRMNRYIQANEIGNFYFIAEDNLVKLHLGKIDAGNGGHIPPLNRELVMVYPKEGSTLHTHPAAVVQGSWVTAEQAEAARAWIEFLHEDAQQQTFMDEGFRPSTSIPLRCPICPRYGVDPVGPRAVIDMARFQPGVRAAIANLWAEVGTGITPSVER